MMRVLWRRLLSVVYAATLVLVGCWLAARVAALYYVHRTVERFEAKYGSIDPALNVRPIVGRAEDGGRFYRAAAELVVPLGRGEKLWARPREAPSEAAFRESFEKVRGRFERAASLLDLGAVEPKCHMTERLPESLSESFPVDGLALLNLARFRLAAARVDRLAGNFDAFDTGVASALSLAACLEKEPTLLLAYGMAIERLALAELIDAWEAAVFGSGLELAATTRKFDSLPALDIAGCLRAEAVVVGPHRSGWLFGHSAHDPWLPRLLSLPALSRALALAEVEQGLGALGAPEKPRRGPAGLLALFGDGATYWTLARKAEAQTSLRSLVRMGLIANRSRIAAQPYPDKPVPREPLAAGPTGLLVDESVVWDRGADGSLSLSLPTTAKLWGELTAKFPLDPAGSFPGWSIRLAAPQAPGGGAS